MFKKTIAYKNYDGEEMVEDFYFHLSKAELIEMEISHEGGFATYLKRIVETKDVNQMIREFKDLILKTIGKKSEDGRRFIKNDEIRDEFAQTEAYSELFMALATQDGAALEFVTALIPSDLAQQVEKTRNQTTTVELPDKPTENNETSDELPEKTVNDYTRAELVEMPQDEFDKLVGTNSSNWSRSILGIAYERKNRTTDAS